ncbi:hypothetical protein [Rhodococcus tukisamuensis]|uniref:Uncharacterized protein n=1 Tax=Rhodococcus tukisamuensis TaxID=168276 RepID=A0A1G6UQL3_9NOCA|nr:hypothetical protein [Rhodococcus tukisamuensis]SDD43720.1 hypothetical protein SAMN05444580_104271 [Rhodococcus tukisamuensis]
MNASTTTTPTDLTTAHGGSMSTEEIKARIEAMFAHDENDSTERTSA